MKQVYWVDLGFDNGKAFSKLDKSFYDKCVKSKISSILSV